MQSRSHWQVLIPAAIGLLIASTGCQGPQGPSGLAPAQLPYVTGEVTFAPAAYDSAVQAEVQISWAPSWPTVKLNDVLCERNDFPSGSELQFFHENLPFSPGDSVHLSIGYLKDDGEPAEATADVKLPGMFHIASPDTADTVQLVLGSGDLTVNWTRSEGADIYDAELSLQYAWLDTFEGWIYYWIWIDTILTDTTLYYSSAQLFPDLVAVDSFDVSFGEFRVAARCGPWQPEEMGNVAGDGMGFFYGITHSDTLQLEVVYNE